MKYCILRWLMVPLLGFIVFSCKYNEDYEETIADEGVKKGGVSQTPGVDEVVIPKTIEEAFDEVVKVLHAPYSSGDHFFKSFKKKAKETIVKNGADSQVGDGKSTGTGTHTMTADAESSTQGSECLKSAQDNTPIPISYKYDKYKPNGSGITINGSIDVFGRGQDGNGGNGNGNGESKCIALSNSFNADRTSTLKITGEYDATLKFTITKNGGNSDISDADYEAKLIGDSANPEGFTVEFIYNSATLKLVAKGKNVELFKQLILVT